MRIFFSLTLLSLFLYSETINEQIHALEDATPKERVKLMNNIKKQLVSMNAEKRTLTLKTLRKKLQHKSKSSHEINEHGEVAKKHTSHNESSNIDNELHQHEQHHENRQEENHAEETNHNDGTK